MDIIVSHINADFDALASMLAARRLYPKAELVFPGSQEKKVRDFIDSFHPVSTTRLKDLDLDKVSRMVVVDTKSPGRLGDLKKLIDKPGVTIHVYDHHPHKPGDITGALDIMEEVGATATIFTEIFRSKGVNPTPMEATVLCLGIYEETGNLLFTSTTERDLKAVAWLIKNGASLKIVSSYMKTELSREELGLLNELMQSSTDLVINNVRVRIARASSDTYIGDAAHLAHRIMDMVETDAIVLMLRMQGKVIIIGRSRVHELDIAVVLRHFGGGGHPTAASATVVEQPLELLQEELEGSLRAAIRPEKTALDLMTRPVVTIDTGKTVKDAELKMTNQGVNVLPVVKDGLYRGLLSRETVEKAIFHGFKNSKVMDFASRDAEVASPGTPQREVESMMVDFNQRFLPVLEDGRITGAITRTDVMRVMYEDFMRKSRPGTADAGARQPLRKNMGATLREKFPREVYDLLVLAGQTAEELKFSAFLVGGSVRDMLRGESNLDVDIVIEGDGIAFAQSLGAKLDAKVYTHKRFGTARIITSKMHLDIATARTEHYEHPAALPTVQMSSVKRDLYRRDFTINTLALRLNPGGFGQMVDFFGGQRDIKDKTLRVLHNMSFIEDPTRAFRAIRFAERFGFKLSKQTEKLIKSALNMDLFSRLSGTRLYDELDIAFAETEPVNVIRQLGRYGLLGVIHPGLSLDKELELTLVSVHDALLWFKLSFMKENPNSTQIYLMALLSALNDTARGQALDRLAVPKNVRQSILRGLDEVEKTLKILPLKDPAKTYALLNPLSLEVLLCAMGFTRTKPKKKEISGYLLELRRIKTILTGRNLVSMGIKPGPVYSQILDSLLAEKLRGNLPEREDEERFVSEIKIKRARATQP